MRTKTDARSVRTAALVLGVGLASALGTMAYAQGSLEGHHAADLVDQAHYAAVHSDQLYTHSGDNRAEGAEHNLARDNIAARFTQYGLITTVEPFNYWGYNGYNVVGEFLGTTRPNDIYIIGAHYDSMTLEWVGGPGADDNATGTAAVLEIARLVSQWQSGATIRFIAFDLEEWGLFGSEAYASAHHTDNIRGMLSPDMLAFRLSPHNRAIVGGRTQSSDVKAALIAALGNYAGIEATDVGEADYSDHASFEDWGFHAAVLDEYDIFSNPNYHSQQDSVETPDYIDYAYATALTRGMMGWLVDAAGVTPEHPAGDMNCDATVDTADINPFVQALSDPAGFALAFPDCHLSNADCNGDGHVDFADINPFMAKFYAPCSGPQALAKLWTADAPEDYLGTSVALSGNVAAVGSNADGFGRLSGTVLVCESQGGTWTQTASLTSPIGSPDDLFGRTVALDGTTLLVGAAGDSETALYAGAVYVFELVGGTWTQTGKLTASDGAAMDAFGQAVALSGDTAVIGAPGADGTGFDQGAAYVFWRVDGGWTERTKLTAADAADYDMFGFSVAIDPYTAVVGAIYHTGGRGAAYVFQEAPGGWCQVAELTAAGGVPDDQLGYAVAVDGNTVVAAAYHPSNGFGRTMAYVFEYVNPVWVERTRLGPWGHTFGASVAMDGQTILVGRDGGDLPAGAGVTYLFQPVNGQWTQVHELQAWDGFATGWFGSAVALSGGSALVGALFQFEPPADYGAAYIFQLNGDGVPWVAEQPADQTVATGESATLSVVAVGPAELSYRWRKDGHRLVDDGHISGVTTATLTINPVGSEDAGVYEVLVSSLCGSVTSAPATLTVSPALTR
jgi:hypothetical protein